MTYYVGQACRVRTKSASPCKDADGVATTPTGATITVEDPSGTETEYTLAGGGVVVTGTGALRTSDFIVNKAGVWLWRLETENPTAVDQGRFVVIDSNV